MNISPEKGERGRYRSPQNQRQLILHRFAPRRPILLNVFPLRSDRLNRIKGHLLDENQSSRFFLNQLTKTMISTLKRIYNRSKFLRHAKM